LDKNQFVADRHRLTAEGYRLIGVKIDGAIIAIASYVITPHPVYYRELQIHDMATSEAFQSKGFGSMLLAELERNAHESQCGRCYVNSRADRAAAHRFYERNGYEQYSTGFVKRVAQS
jgi:GNAT superfamily N-acetyltransferase